MRQQQRSPGAGDGADRRLYQTRNMRQRTVSASALAFLLGLAVSLAWSLAGGYGF
jgi:hypothetical protein